MPKLYHISSHLESELELGRENETRRGVTMECGRIIPIVPAGTDYDLGRRTRHVVAG